MNQWSWSGMISSAACLYYNIHRPTEKMLLSLLI